jgi:hypothetical protein
MVLFKTQHIQADNSIKQLNNLIVTAKPKLVHSILPFGKFPYSAYPF